MQRVDTPEILDSDACSPAEAKVVLSVIGNINRRFGGVATTQQMIDRVIESTGSRRLSLLEVAAGLGEVPRIVQQNCSERGIVLDVTLLDILPSHLPVNHSDGTGLNRTNLIAANGGVVGDALALPFGDNAFDLISCNLFMHHLNPQQSKDFMREAIRVSRQAVLINDLIRHPLHLALVYASFPLMRNRIAWLDGLTSVRRAYIPEEIEIMLADAFPNQSAIRTEICRKFLFRMGAILWKTPVGSD
jgi:ubiquinone/menaquinone biosynthesis C-methylase UbiE